MRRLTDRPAPSTSKKLTGVLADPAGRDHPLQAPENLRGAQPGEVILGVVHTDRFIETVCPCQGILSPSSPRYREIVPKLWNETIEAHRRDVREAVLDATAALVAEHGLLSVTMSRIAEDTGIGRATLYKYFPDVETILLAWQERQIAGHLKRLAEVRDHPGGPSQRLAAVLEEYGLIAHESRRHHDTELAALMHRNDQVDHAEKQLFRMIRDLLAEAVKAGDIRDDVAPAELASYCLHALTAAGRLPSKAAVRRLVAVTLAGIAPPR